MPNTTMRIRLVAAGIAGTLALAAVTPSLAAPFPTSTASVKSAAGGDVIDVRWRGGWGWAAGGFAAGAIIGGALAARPYYYDPYYYPGPYYAPPPVVYAPPPVYAAPPPEPVYAAPVQPNGPVRQCWVTTDRDKAAGYWHAC